MNCDGVFDDLTNDEVKELKDVMKVEAMCNVGQVKLQQNKEGDTDKVHLEDESLCVDSSSKPFPPHQQHGHRRLKHPLPQKTSHFITFWNKTVTHAFDQRSVVVDKEKLACMSKKSQTVMDLSGRHNQTSSNYELTRGNLTTDEQQQSSSYSTCLSGKLTRFTPLTKIGTAPSASRYLAECITDPREKTKNEEECNGMVNESSLFGDILTDELLRLWTNSEDIKTLLSAEFRVDATRVMCIDSLSSRMPCLNSLKLTKSNIPQLRMLGTRFINLKRLWIGSSHLQSLSGIGACAPSLEELYASFNLVYDITPLLDLSETLEVVDLEGNAIRSMDSLLACLPMLKKVKYLTLGGNPVAMRLSCSVDTSDCCLEDGASTTVPFRERIISLMPKLQYLDDVAVAVKAAQSLSSKRKKKGASVNGVKRPQQSSTHVDPLNVSLHGEYMFLQHCIREFGFDALDAAVEEEVNAVCSRPQSSFSLSLLRARSSCASSAGLMRSQRPCSSSYTTNCATAVPNCVNSDLGKGYVGGGNATNALLPFSLTSSMTCGSAGSGSAVSVCHRLPPLQPLKVSGYAMNGRNSGDSSDGGGGGDTGGKSVAKSVRRRRNEAFACPLRKESSALQGAPQGDDSNACMPDDSLLSCVEDDVDAPLFDDDDDDLEVRKENLLRRMDSRRAGMRHWAKYLGGEAAVSSQGDCESHGLSALSRSTYTRTTSASSDPAALLSFSRRQTATLAANANGGEKGGGDEEDERAWRQELLRSVVQSRLRTARAALDARCQRLGDENVR